MLTMMREFTVKEVDRRMIECDSIRLAKGIVVFYLLPTTFCCCSTRLPAGSEVQKEWLLYKDNMKATVEQYKVYFTVICISIIINFGTYFTVHFKFFNNAISSISLCRPLIPNKNHN